MSYYRHAEEMHNERMTELIMGIIFILIGAIIFLVQYYFINTTPFEIIFWKISRFDLIIASIIMMAFGALCAGSSGEHSGW